MRASWNGDGAIEDREVNIAAIDFTRLKQPGSSNTRTPT